MKTLARWLFIISVPVLLLTASIAVAVNSAWFYKYGFEKYHISQVTGLSQDELNKVADGLISYWNSSQEDIRLTVVKDGRQFELFNEREVAHLRDVKKLWWLDYEVCFGSLVYFLLYISVSLFRKGRSAGFAREIIGGSFMTLGLILAMGLGTLLDFENLFYKLHLIAFSNDFWQLDPARDYLLMLVPEGFWFDAALLIVLFMVLLGSVLLGGGAWLYLKKAKK